MAKFDTFNVALPCSTTPSLELQNGTVHKVTFATFFRTGLQLILISDCRPIWLITRVLLTTFVIFGLILDTKAAQSVQHGSSKVVDLKSSHVVKKSLLASSTGPPCAPGFTVDISGACMPIAIFS